jgi:hypothetical protein
MNENAGAGVARLGGPDVDALCADAGLNPDFLLKPGDWDVLRLVAWGRVRRTGGSDGQVMYAGGMIIDAPIDIGTLERLQAHAFVTPPAGDGYWAATQRGVVLLRAHETRRRHL